VCYLCLAMASRNTRSIVGVVVVVALVFAAVQATASTSAAPRWIVFSASKDGTAPAQLYRVETTGTGAEPITTGNLPATNPAFAADGKRLVFTRLGSGIFRINLDGTGLHRLTSGARDSFPAWSPDGKRVAFLRPTKAAWAVFTVPPSGGTPHRLQQAPSSGRPQWTADGKTLLLPTAADISKVNPQTGRVRARINLAGDLSVSQAVTISPDLKTIAYLAQRPPTGPEDCGESPCPAFALYLAHVGGKPKRFAIGTGPAGWSPDGKTLAYIAKGALTLSPPVVGATHTTVTSGPQVAAGDAPPAWQPR
jgi:hypothetical protein